MAVVVNIDQRSSRRAVDDPIPTWVGDLNRMLAANLRRRFERTAGDEIQGVVDDPGSVVAIVRRSAEVGQWYVGVGAGDATLGRTSRASRGEAFIRARAAVMAAKRRSVPISLDVGGGDAQEDAETALAAYYALLVSRSERGWQVAHLLEEHRTRRAVAEVLGVSEQAVGQVAQRAHVDLEPRVARLARRLLEQAIATS